MDGIRNEYIRGTAHVICYRDKATLKEARLKWFDIERGEIVKISVERILWLELEVKRKSVDLWMSRI